MWKPFLVLCHLVYLTFGFPIEVSAQNNHDLITDKLIEHGFENVGTSDKNDTLQVYFENRIYRFNPKGIAKAISIISAHADEGTIQLFPLTDGVRIIQLTFNQDAYKAFVNGEIDGPEFHNSLHVTLTTGGSKPLHQLRNSSLLKADFSVLPTWNAKFGDFDNPVESNINLIPELTINLLKGLTMKAQLIIPVQNDHFFVAERETIRPGNVTLNHFAALEDNFYFNITAGFFDKNRTGAMIDFYKVFLDGLIELGANIGFTGYYSFTGITTEYYDKTKYLTALLSAQYRYKPYDVVGRLTVGNHLYNVFATRFEVMRQFGEVQIGFFAMKSNDDYDAGFNFRIPIPPSKYNTFKWIRLRPSESFGWEYRAKGFPQNGVTVNTGHNINQVLLENNPDFISKRVLIEIQKIINN